MHFYSSCFLILCALLAVSCTKSDSPTPNPPEYISNDPIVAYTDHVAIPLVGQEEAISHLEARGNYIYYSTFDDQLVAYEQSSGSTTVMLREVHTFSMESGAAGVYFCTASGIYQVGEDGASVVQRTPHHCYDIEAVSTDELYYSSFRAYGSLSPYRLFRLRGDSVEAFTSGLGAEELKFTRLQNGEFFVYAESMDRAIHRIGAQGEVIQTFQGQDYPLRESYLARQVFLVPTEEGLLLVGDSGAAYPDIVTWSSAMQDWGKLLDPAILPREKNKQEKLFQLRAPTYTDVLPWRDDILVATTVAGCRGILRLQPQGGEPIGYDDFSLVQDSNFSIGQCLDGFSLDPTTNSLYVHSQQEVMRLSLP